MRNHHCESLETKVKQGFSTFIRVNANDKLKGAPAKRHTILFYAVVVRLIVVGVSGYFCSNQATFFSAACARERVHSKQSLLGFIVHLFTLYVHIYSCYS